MSEVPANYNYSDVPAMEEMGFFKRVTGIVFSPGKTVENLAARPRVIFPLILTAVSLAALYALRMPLYQEFLRKTMEASSEFTESLTGIQMTPELIEQSISSSTISGIATTPLGSLFYWLFTTVVFFAIFKIFGGKGRFKQYLSITGYAYVITVLGYIVVFAASFFTGSLHLEIPLTSLANLLSSDLRGSFMFGMLRGVDLFSIWYFAVIAIGMKIVSGFRKYTSYGIIACAFLIGLIIGGVGELAVGAYM